MRVRWPEWSKLKSDRVIIPVYGANPENCYLDTDVEFFGKNITIYPNVRVTGKIRLDDNVTLKDGSILEGEGYIGSGAIIGPFCELIGPEIGRDCIIEGQIIDSQIGEDCEIGRPAQIKRASLSWGVKAKHFCQIEDMKVGCLTNISVGVTTLNSDGVGKRKTEIGNRTFIGGNVTIIGGVKIGNEVYIADVARVSKDISDYTYFNPGRALRDSRYRAYQDNSAWYLEGNYIPLQKPISQEERGRFINAVRKKYGFLRLNDARFGKWLSTPQLHMGNRTPIKCLREEGVQKAMPCLLEECEHSIPKKNPVP